MAWRIEESVRRGEIDARERGVVRGRLWLHGSDEPVVLELKGSACPDVAGCFLKFENPYVTMPMRPDLRFDSWQRGVTGDLTASRKSALAGLPADHREESCKGLFYSQPVTNGLYLEWFSDSNGRVVIESSCFKITISLPEWTMTSEEEADRKLRSETAFTEFIEKLNRALEAVRHEPPLNRKWDEFDYERMMRECDARREKYLELLDKYRDHKDQNRIIAQEMGWRRREPDGAGLHANAAAAEEAGENDSSEMRSEQPDIECSEDVPMLQPDLATEGVDWVRDEDGSINHPLALRALNTGKVLWNRCQACGLGVTSDPDLTCLLGEYRIVSMKLAGALDELAYGRDKGDPAFVVARLKRALPHLHAAQAALEHVATRLLLPEAVIRFTRSELFCVREEILRLMGEFRSSPLI